MTYGSGPIRQVNFDDDDDDAPIYEATNDYGSGPGYRGSRYGSRGTLHPRIEAYQRRLDEHSDMVAYADGKIAELEEEAERSAFLADAAVIAGMVALGNR